MKTRNLIIFLLLVLVFLTSCAHTVDIHACVNTEPYGFWSGLWHGLICLFTFIGSLFDKDIAIYAVNNNGGWYNFGFVLGAGLLTGGSVRVSK